MREPSSNPAGRGIAYHHISDTYIALFSHYIPCGVWQAIYTLEGLLKNNSEIQLTSREEPGDRRRSSPGILVAHG